MADCFLPVQASLGYVLRIANTPANTLTFLSSPRPTTVFVLNTHILFITSLTDIVYSLFSLLLPIPEVRSLNIRRMLLLTWGTALVLLFLQVTNPLQKRTQRGPNKQRFIFISELQSLLVCKQLAVNSHLTPHMLSVPFLSGYNLKVSWTLCF